MYFFGSGYKSVEKNTSLAPSEDLYPIVYYYWGLGLNDKEIVEHALDHFDRALFGLR